MFSFQDILVIRFQPSSEQEKISYIALYSYLSNKNRYGVIGKGEKSIKDFYVIPLPSHKPIHQVLLPLDGPGFEESRPHMLIGVVVRNRQSKLKKYYDPHLETWVHNGVPATSKPSRTSLEDEEDSYTPPPSFGRENSSSASEQSLPLPLTSEMKKHSPDKEANDEDNERLALLAELNRQIERDRKELSEMQKKVEVDDQSPTSDTEDQPLTLDKISLPSNLQEILDSIQKKEEEIKDKEDEIKRRMNLGPAVLPSKDIDLRLLQNAPPPASKDQDMRVTVEPVKDPRIKETDKEDQKTSLSKMSDADLLAKAMEMESSPTPAEPKLPFVPPGGNFIPPPMPPPVNMDPGFMGRMPPPMRFDGPPPPWNGGPPNSWQRGPPPPPGSPPRKWGPRGPPHNWQDMERPKRGLEDDRAHGNSGRGGSGWRDRKDSRPWRGENKWARNH